MNRFSLAVVICSLMASPAYAAQCAPHDAMRAGLDRKYGEVPVAMGQANVASPRMVEVYANRVTGTWTIVQTDPSGMACLAAAGIMWQAIAPGVPS